MTDVKPIPDGCPTLTPHLVVKGGPAAIEWYKRVFGAEEMARQADPSGRLVMHAELRVGNSAFMLCDEVAPMGLRSPETIGGSPVTLHLYVEDVDAAFEKAVEAGARPVMPVTDMFWGDRYGKLVDPFGHHWSMATHVEDVSPDEIARRLARFG